MSAAILARRRDGTEWLERGGTAYIRVRLLPDGTRVSALATHREIARLRRSPDWEWEMPYGTTVAACVHCGRDLPAAAVAVTPEGPVCADCRRSR